jgi:mRNA-degrading endonuclease RelE of RelBE toxin-antitoxin system
MIRYSFRKSFDKSVKKLPRRQKEKVKKDCLEIIEVIEGKRDLRKGLRLKQLIGNVYEISEGRKIRIIFSWDNDCVDFILAGNHDQIKKSLKENL